MKLYRSAFVISHIKCCTFCTVKCYYFCQIKKVIKQIPNKINKCIIQIQLSFYIKNKLRLCMCTFLAFLKRNISMSTENASFTENAFETKTEWSDFGFLKAGGLIEKVVSFFDFRWRLWNSRVATCLSSETKHSIKFLHLVKTLPMFTLVLYRSHCISLCICVSAISCDTWTHVEMSAAPVE